MARPSTIPVGLRLPADVLERANKAASEMGLNRSAFIVLAINKLCDGDAAAEGSPAPVSAPIMSVVDQPARDALVALKGRVEALEKATAEVMAKTMMIEQIKQESPVQQVEVAKDDFADQFATA